jgi:hypothetical protein
MARLPVPGSDDGVWGDVLNDYLGVAHNSDGTIKSSALPLPLAQSQTHASADTDSADSALHHTLGTGANQIMIIAQRRLQGRSLLLTVLNLQRLMPRI